MNNEKQIGSVSNALHWGFLKKKKEKEKDTVVRKNLRGEVTSVNAPRKDITSYFV